MPRWTRTSAPKWEPNAVAGVDGWYHPVTNELLVCMDNPPLVPDSPATIVQVKLEHNAQVYFQTGDTIIVRVTFSQKVVVTGTPQITLKIGSNNRTANYVKGSGTATLQFAYVVQASDSATPGNFYVGIPATAATLTLETSNAQLVYTAKTAGTSGNSITVAYVNGGASQSLSVSVTGSAITVNVATNGSSVITSTALQVQAAIQAFSAANALVTVGLGSGNGSGVVTAVSATNLATGTNASQNSISLNSGTILDKAKFATLTSGSGNAQVLFTALEIGTRGNNVNVTIINPGTNNASLAVSLTNNYNILVSLATNGSAVATSTANQVISALNGNAAIAAIITASVGTGNGSGTVVVASQTNLTGGTASPSVAATPLTWTPINVTNITVA